MGVRTSTSASLLFCLIAAGLADLPGPHKPAELTLEKSPDKSNTVNRIDCKDTANGCDPAYEYCHTGMVFCASCRHLCRDGSDTSQRVGHNASYCEVRCPRYMEELRKNETREAVMREWKDKANDSAAELLACETRITVLACVLGGLVTGFILVCIYFRLQQGCHEFKNIYNTYCDSRRSSYEDSTRALPSSSTSNATLNEDHDSRTDTSSEQYINVEHVHLQQNTAPQSSQDESESLLRPPPQKTPDLSHHNTQERSFLRQSSVEQSPTNTLSRRCTYTGSYTALNHSNAPDSGVTLGRHNPKIEAATT